MSRATLAIVMMTKNEEARLAACLDRVAGWADEIVIIDDHSTDRTVDVARRYTEKIFVMASEDDHCRQWQRGFDRAASDWVLHIDADEWVTPALKQAIDGILEDAQGHSAFEIMRLNHFLGRPMRHGGWYHRHRVLFRRDRARCEGHGIHSGARMRVDGTTGFLDADVEHYPFASIAQFLDRQNLYSSVEAASMTQELAPAPGRTIWFQAAWRPFKLFWKSYHKQQGRREGWHGLVFGVLYAFVHFLHWAKYWELVSSKQAAPLSCQPNRA
jgi:glycosyltransferase involved in cell wall biosynthesis